MVSHARKIALVDDDPAEREAISILLVDAGFEPIVIDRLEMTLEAAAEQLRTASDVAVCDNRLSRRGLASFSGAALVACLYDQRFPALLVSGYLKDDQDGSIREYRDKIPVSLSKNETNVEQLTRGIGTCIDEAAGYVNPERYGIRSLIRIVERRKHNNEDFVGAIVPAWSVDETVWFPTSLLGDLIDILPDTGVIQPDTYLLGNVNVGAVVSGDLYFKDFELAPDVRDDDGLA